jgi:hypothetical protein
MSRQSTTTLQTLVQQWGEVTAALAKMGRSVSVRPDDGWRIFKPVDGSPGEFEIGPVVFNLPEVTRARGPRNLRREVALDLFIVVHGTIVLRPDENSARGLLTEKFMTRVAYFRRQAAGLSHVYGTHCDFSLNEVGHPVFHSQLRSYCEYSKYVREQFEVAGTDDEDCVRGLLQNVRVPTAQLDVFSVFLQICADHLLGQSSGEEEKRAFDILKSKGGFLRGAAAQAPHLMSEAATSCYRATHWYPAAMQ